MEYKLNGKNYTTKELDFLGMCELEEKGLTMKSLQKMESEPFTPILACVCYITGLTKEQANKEITAHLKNGGSFEEIAKCTEILADFFKLAGLKE